MHAVLASLLKGFYMFYDTLWALVLGFALSGAVQTFVSRKELQRTLGDHRPATIVKSSVLGMVSSSCSYAASALSKSLFVRGADFTSSMVFMFASTNLVIELGVVLWLLIGWQFAAAEFLGGLVMIAILALVLPRVTSVPELDAARARLRSRSVATGHAERGAAGEDDEARRPWRARICSRAGWSDAAGYTVSDLTMLRKELVIGYVIAGFASAAVPVSVWRALFLTGHGTLATVENVILGPVLAFISFVCSIGNVPLAAALWKGGIGFGGVIAFIFADLLALPLVLIYRKFYGTRLALKLSLVFWATMSVAGLVTELGSRLLGAIPGAVKGDLGTTHVGLNYTTVLNALALVALGYLYYLYRHATSLGAGQGYAKDVVCGMQVERASAPASHSFEGAMYYFCSDKCEHKFAADPGRYIAGSSNNSPSSPKLSAAPGTDQDPVCGMEVGSDSSLTERYEEQSYHFCSPGCQVKFQAEPELYLPSALDPVCSMTVTPAHAAASAEAGGRPVYFCSSGCRERFAKEPARYQPAAAS